MTEQGFEIVARAYFPEQVQMPESGLQKQVTGCRQVGLVRSDSFLMEAAEGVQFLQGPHDPDGIVRIIQANDIEVIGRHRCALRYTADRADEYKGDPVVVEDPQNLKIIKRW